MIIKRICSCDTLISFIIGNLIKTAIYQVLVFNTKYNNQHYLFLFVITKQGEYRLKEKNDIYPSLMMKRAFNIIFLIITIILVSCSRDVYMYSSFHEPATDGLRYLWSRDGMHWDSIPGTWLAPKVGKQHVMRDPSIQSTPDGVFHMVWTSSWRGDRGFGYASSCDLVHWSKERLIEIMSDTTTVNVWAPELFYDDSRKEMMIVWASCVPYKFEKGQEDENNNHRLYYTTTKDFVTFTPAKLLFDTHFSAIDATILKRGENDYVMVLKDNTRQNRNLRISFAKDVHGPWTEPSETFTENFVEGPTTVKLGKDYIIP